MRSLIIIEVEHGEDTDGFEAVIQRALDQIDLSEFHTTVNDYTVHIDLPDCFSLERRDSDGVAPL